MAAINYTISYYLRVALCHLAILVGLHSSSGPAHAKSVRVGGDAGWTSADPATGLVPDYAAWAASQTLSVQDILEFHFNPGAYILFQVDSQAALDTCNFTGGVPIFDLNARLLPVGPSVENKDSFANELYHMLRSFTQNLL